MTGVYMPNGDLNRMGTAKSLVADVMNEFDFGKVTGSVTPEDIYVVWFCKTLQNWKALLSTDVVDTGIYFEVTYNGDKGEAYVDVYDKAINRAVLVTPRSDATP